MFGKFSREKKKKGFKLTLEIIVLCLGGGWALKRKTIMCLDGTSINSVVVDGMI